MEAGSVMRFDAAYPDYGPVICELIALPILSN